MKHLFLTLTSILFSFASFAVVGPITGTNHVCVGSTTTLADTSLGGTWTSSAVTIATVGSSTGIVSGVASGSATITYTTGSGFVTMAFTVNPLPALHNVTGGGNYCSGGAGVHIGLDLSDLGVSYQLMRGGTTVVGSPMAGTGFAIDFGLHTISGVYTVVATIGSTGCSRTMTGSATVGINPLPTFFPLFFAGSGGICIGSGGSTLYLGGSQAGVSYQLFLGATAVGVPLTGTGATLSFGSWTIPGAYTCAATNLVTGCANTMGSATLSILPTPGPIAGPSSVCIGSTITLADTAAGGTWSSSNTSVATVGSTGVVSGITTGTTTISYILSSGCYATTSITVINLVPPITGSGGVCVGGTTPLSDGASGGVWTSSNTARATVGSSSGIVTGVSAGTATITYTIGSSCGYVTKPVTVGTSPAPITGITSICAGAVSTLHDVTTGGVWTSANPSVASVGSLSGVVTGASAGTAGISYTVGGCAATTTMAIDPTPLISGSSAVCVSDTVILTTSIPGSWTSSNPTVAGITSAGVVSGLTPGTTTITCNSFSTGCVSTRVITVTSSCSGTPAGGTAHASFLYHCSANADTIYLTGASTSCGVGHQWEYSTDSFTWYNITGGIYDTVVVNPKVNTYYRCKLRCYTSSLSAYSAPVHVIVYNSITSHPIYNTPSYSCTGPDFQINTCGIGISSYVKSWFGDGTSAVTPIYTYSYYPDSSTHTDILHAYNLPGTYTVKQVLYDGTTAQDSVTGTVTYNYCRTLPVFFYFDANNNCIADDPTSVYHTIYIEVDSNGIHLDTIVSSCGFYYRALGDSGTIYRFRVIAHDTGLHLSCPTSGIIYDTISGYVNTYYGKSIGFNCASTASYNLGFTNTDLDCGRHVAYGTIDVNNTHCSPQNATVTMNIDPKYVFDSAYPAPASIVGNTVTWNINPLTVYTSYWYQRHIYYRLATPGGVFLTAGDTVYNTFRITPNSGDVDTTNNFVERVDTIFTSFDPNRITVSPGGLVIPCTQLKYTIDFENTGNDTARNIAVIDTLPDNVNPKTIKLVSSSAPVTLAIVKFGGHTLIKFDFPNINLPDSSHHLLCDGQVVFTVNLRSGLSDGVTINNKASIYFDDNLPVVTNTVHTTIGMSPITGPGNVCNSLQIQLNNLSLNGTWSRTNTTASVGTHGLVTGLAAGVDTIKYTLSNSCTSRAASKTVTVEPTIAPSVTIATNVGAGDTVCDGTTPLFTPTPVNGGTTPSYEWFVNGISSGTGSTFGYAPPHTGDVVSVKLTSNAHCVVPDTAATGMVLTVITPAISPITLNAYPGIYISPGTSDTFTASVSGSGPPPTYQWLLNGSPIPGATTDTFISNTLVNNDSITCVATGTDLCKLKVFNSFIITVGNVGIKNPGSNAQMVLFPNPNNGRFTIRGKTGNPVDEELNLEIMNALGQTIYRRQVTSRNGIVNEEIEPGTISKGIYLLNLQSGTDRTIFRFLVE